MDSTIKLPPEILTDIFEWLYFASLSKYNASPPDGGVIRGLCWPVSRVCKYWRDVALASPFLWTFLPRVSLGHHYRPSPEERLEALTELISRARNEPLHVSVMCRKDSWIVPLQDVLDLILSLSNQWGSISIDAPAERIDQLFKLTQGRVSRLKSLCIHLLEWHKPETEVEAARQVALDMFKNAPMLKDVIISGSLNTTKGWHIDLDTRSLENLRVGIGSVVHSIRPTPGVDFSKLTTLQMWDRGIFDYAEMADAEVTLAFPALRSLTYKCTGSFNPDERFLLLPVAPLLEELSITAGRGDIASLLIDLHRRSTPRANCAHPLKLLYLRVNLCYSFARDYIEVLKLFSNLETLDMNFPAVEVLNELSKVGGAQMLVPQLRYCSFAVGGDNFDRYGVNTAVAELAYERCERSPLFARQNQQLFELCIHVHYRPEISLTPRKRPGFGTNDWVPLWIGPTRLERWYDPNSLVQRSTYSNAVENIPKMLLKGYGETEVAKFDYGHTLKLVENVGENYKAKELVEFLETNANIALISAAYFIRTKMLKDSKNENSTYRQIIRLFKRVRKDIKSNSVLFHWIWESSSDKIWIRYISDFDELRAKPNRFANAVLGISDDLWILDDF